MKAYVYRRYGGPEVVELADVPKPVPRNTEVLVKVLATTVNSGDWRVRTLNVPRGFRLVARLALGVTRPRQPIMGTEFAGIVEAVGRDVTSFKPGDAVFGFPGGKMGAHAQYLTMAADGPIAHKPSRLDFEEAAALCFGGTTALHFLRKAGVKSGDKVLVIGASGAVGVATVQLAKHLGAEVTGVTSTRNVELVASVGANRVIDYTRDDFMQSGETYDVIVDTVAATSSESCRPLLRDQGRYVSVAGGLPEMLAGLRKPSGDGKRVISGPADERPEDVRLLAQLAGSGELKPVIDRRYAWDEMVAAHAHVETGRKVGSVVVSVDHA